MQTRSEIGLRRRTRLGTLAVAALTTLPVLPALDVARAENVTPTDAPFLWMIDADPPSFLYGTIHLPDDRVLALPDAVTAALDAADVVYTEIPFDADTQMKMAGAVMATGDATFKAAVPKTLYDRTAAYVTTYELPMLMMAFDSMKVWAVAAQLAVLDYLPQLMAGKQPLDALLTTRATEAGKDTDALETVEEQLAAFDGLSVDDQVVFLEQTLDYLEESTDGGAEELVEAYLAGDPARLVEIMYAYMEEDDPVTDRFIESLLVERNALMAERIQKKMKERPDAVHFFAVGAMHYPLDHGILAELAEAGHDIERLGGTDRETIEERVAALSR